MNANKTHSFNHKGITKKKMKILPTGITGLDELLGGGIPQGRTTAIIGSAGEGKTVFINEFLYQGMMKYKENGVFVTAEERPQQIIENVRGFGWDYEALIKQKRLAFVDLSPSKEFVNESGMNYNCDVIVERVKHAVRKIRAKRIVIDAIGSLLCALSNNEAVRKALFSLCDEMREMNVTSMMTMERVKDSSRSTRFGVEEFVADGVIELEMRPGQQEFMRKLYIKKIRGMGFRTGIVDFDISNEGVSVFPKIPNYQLVKKANYKARKKTGVNGLDKILKGGIPQGHCVLVTGNTGTGKTTLALRFLKEAMDKKENVIFVNMEEPSGQIKKTAQAHNWNFDKYEREGKLTFINTPIIDIQMDRLLYMIVNAVKDTKATCLVFDSVSTLFSDAVSSEQVRQFLDQLARFLKSQGITSIFNYLSKESFGASKDQLLTGLETNQMSLSSIVDGIVLLLYVERDQSVSTMMNVLKMRGIEHDKGIYEIGINQTGVFVGGKFKK